MSLPCAPCTETHYSACYVTGFFLTSQFLLEHGLSQLPPVNAYPTDGQWVVSRNVTCSTGVVFQCLVSTGGNEGGSFGDEEGEPARPPPQPLAMPSKFKVGVTWSSQPGSARPPASFRCVLPAALASHDYILKIVPTVYEDKSGKQRYSYQYTVANKVRGRQGWTARRCVQ